MKTQAVFHIVDHFCARGNRFLENYKSIFLGDYFTALIYLANFRADKLGIFIHFTFINLPLCSKTIN